VEGRFRSRPHRSSWLGVRRHRVFRPLDDPNYVVGEFEFETSADAAGCRDALIELWLSRRLVARFRCRTTDRPRPGAI
jgi:hypothetical protein